MNVGISNLSWLPEEEDLALKFLFSRGVRVLELAPARYWPKLELVSEVEAVDLRGRLEGQGFSVGSLQAVLFGRPELQLFSEGGSEDLLAFFTRLVRLSAWLGASNIVFGGPKNRVIPDGLCRERAWARAVDFFQAVGEEAKSFGVAIGVEANPAIYGCNFLTTAAEAVRFVREVSHPGVHWHLDTGELAINGMAGLTREMVALAGSLHVSEPKLQGFSSPSGVHDRVSAMTREAGLFPVIEMLYQPQGLSEVGTALDFVRSRYEV